MGALNCISWVVVKNLPEDGQRDAEGFSSLETPEEEAEAKLHHHSLITTKSSYIFSAHFNCVNKIRTLITISAQGRYGVNTFHISVKSDWPLEDQVGPSRDLATVLRSHW